MLTEGVGEAKERDAHAVELPDGLGLLEGEAMALLEGMSVGVGVPLEEAVPVGAAVSVRKEVALAVAVRVLAPEAVPLPVELRDLAADVEAAALVDRMLEAVWLCVEEGVLVAVGVRVAAAERVLVAVSCRRRAAGAAQEIDRRRRKNENQGRIVVFA